MPTEFRVSGPLGRPGEVSIEVWYDGEFQGILVPAFDGRGLSIVSGFTMEADVTNSSAFGQYRTTVVFTDKP